MNGRSRGHLVTLCFVVLVLTAGCLVAPRGPPYTGTVLAIETNGTPANATVVQYGALDVEGARVAVRNASEAPDGMGEAHFGKSDWKRIEQSDVGDTRLGEDMYVRYDGRTFRVYVNAAG